MKPNYKQVIELTRQILADNRIQTPPVPIKLITENFGLAIGAIDFQEDASRVAGLIDLKNSLIVVNGDDSPQRQAFTVAHELGHYLLHRDEVKKEGNVNIMFRGPIGKVDDDWMEQEANCFAANLLVPDDLLQKYIEVTADQNKLSKIFGVSKDVIGFRLLHQYS